MQVRGHISAVQSQRGIAVAHFPSVEFQIAQYLVIGAVLFEDVDHVVYRVGVPSET